MFFAVPLPWKTKHGVEPLIINSKIKKMNNELINFHHEMFGDIRAIEKDGEPWFVGKDLLRHWDTTTQETLFTNMWTKRTRGMASRFATPSVENRK